MANQRVVTTLRGLGIAALLFGVLGGVFYWWVPLGMVLSLTGLIMGIVAWVNGPSPAWRRGLALAGILLSLATLGLDLVIASRGLEIIQLVPYR